jgi:hypothetical protein
MTRTIGWSFAAILFAAASSSTPARAQDAPEGDGWAQRIPAGAMQELLRCRRQQRPEQECFAQLSESVAKDRARQAQRLGSASPRRT